MGIPLLSIGPVHIRFKGCWMVFFIFSQILIVKSLNKQWMRRLIWVCTVCLCPTKRTLGLNGLIKDERWFAPVPEVCGIAN